jgi:hypothetical protein
MVTQLKLLYELQHTTAGIKDTKTGAHSMTGHRWNANDGREFADFMFSGVLVPVARGGDHVIAPGMGMTCKAQAALLLFHEIEMRLKFSFPGIEDLSEPG